jgi:demethylmenaquinone methyltransferase/2-methoxy-6-polyprenyl-1,4-benzoquinol methylase
MLDKAMRRVAQSGWDNVIPVNNAAAEFDVAVSADAVLLCATHDVLRSPSALANVFRHVRPGARVAATGGKWAAPWLWPLNLLVYQVHAPYVSSFTGFDRPWRNLHAHCRACTSAGSGGTPAFRPPGRPRHRPCDRLPRRSTHST